MLDPVCQALAADIVTSKSGLVTFDSSVTEKGLTINARYEVGEDSYMQTVEIPPAKLREGGFFINSELWPYLYDGGEGKEEKIELADIEDTLLVTYNAADAKLRGAEAADRAKAVTSGLGEN